MHPAKHEVRFHQSRLVHDFIYQGVLSVLQQQLESPLPLEAEGEPAPRHVPENRVAAGRNHFAEPAQACEPTAPRYASAPSAGSSAPRPTAASWPHAQPGYQKQQGEVYRQLLQTPTPATKSPAAEPAVSALAGHSQSFGRVLTIVGNDCALLEREGNIYLLALSVAERWLRQAQLTPGEGQVCAQPLLIDRGFSSPAACSYPAAEKPLPSAGAQGSSRKAPPGQNRCCQPSVCLPALRWSQKRRRRL